MGYILLSTQQISAQTAVLLGTVLNERNEPVGNAKVAIKPANQETFTDASGKYNLPNLSSGDYTLEISCKGYETISEFVRIESNDRITLDFYLKTRVVSINEVIIVGYARQLKKEVIGNITKVQPKELTVNPGISLDASLQGKAAGVNIIQSSGIAGAGALIRIRGIASLSAGGDPLFVVDGIPITQDQFIPIGQNGGGQQNNPLSFINANDIESIEILKDAAAAGIYGSRGANGVILITTKRMGKKEEKKFSFVQSLGTSQPTVVQNMLNSKEWLQLYQEAWENDGRTGRASLPGGVDWTIAENTNTNWADQVLRTGIKSESNLNLIYKTGKLKHFNSFSYLNAGSYLAGNSYNRLAGRINTDWEITSKTKLRLGLNLTQGNNNRQSQSWQGSLGTAYSVALPFYLPNRATDFGYSGNPLLRREAQDWVTRENRLLSTLHFESELWRNFLFEWHGALDRMAVKDQFYLQAKFQEKDLVPISARKSESILNNYVNNNYLSNLTFTYFISKNSKTNLTLFFGTEYQRSTNEGFSYTIRGINRQLEANDVPATFPRVWEAWSFLSYFIRLNSRIAKKIYLQASWRNDGSSRFGENNRFGNFPSAGIGYLLTEEKFMKRQKLFSYIKLRSGWGLTGNSQIPNFVRFGIYNNPPNGNTYINRTILQPVSQSNPNLRWEKCRILDAGFEIGLLKNRIYMEMAVYDKLTTDVLLDSRIQSSTGMINPDNEFRYFQNIGSISNRGIEFLFNAAVLDKFYKGTKRFLWNVKLIGSRNVNEVISIGTTAPDAITGSGDTRVIPGQPVGVNYLVRFYGVDPATGLPIFLDKEGRQTSQFSLANRVINGNVQPNFTASFQNSFEFNKFTFGFMIYGVQGGTIYDDAMKRQMTFFNNWNLRTEVFDRWQKPGDNAKYPKLTLNPATYGGLENEANYNTTQWLYDASFLRLREVIFSYRIIDNTNNQDRKIKGLTFSLRGFNLWLWTKYPGDPEVVRDHTGPAARNISPNVTYLTPPQERSIIFTTKIDF